MLLIVYDLLKLNLVEVFILLTDFLNSNFQINPALIGGMTVAIGDKFVDMSMATKIKTYTNLLKQAV